MLRFELSDFDSHGDGRGEDSLAMNPAYKTTLYGPDQV